MLHSLHRWCLSCCSHGFVAPSCSLFVPGSRGFAFDVSLMSPRHRTVLPCTERVLWASGAIWSVTQLHKAGVLLPLQAKDACSQVDCPGDCARVFALRDKILGALVFELHSRLYSLLRCLARVPITCQILTVTGIGHSLSDAVLMGEIDCTTRNYFCTGPETEMDPRRT